MPMLQLYNDRIQELEHVFVFQCRVHTHLLFDILSFFVGGLVGYGYDLAGGDAVLFEIRGAVDAGGEWEVSLCSGRWR